jgi:hypothetical protein
MLGKNLHKKLLAQYSLYLSCELNIDSINNDGNYWESNYSPFIIGERSVFIKFY